MRTIGLLGGMSWQSSIEYERIINTMVRERLGGSHSADLDARRLEAAGAELILLCTNTMHRVADDIEAAISVPFLHLADVTARAVLATGTRRVALLGTRFTMEEDFYRDRLERAGVEVTVPDEPGRTIVHDVIYDELVRGIVRPASRDAYLEVIGGLVDAGAEGVIAGCTEIELLVSADHLTVPWFPTTRLHALAAVAFALDGTAGIS